MTTSYPRKPENKCVSSSKALTLSLSPSLPHSHLGINIIFTVIRGNAWIWQNNRCIFILFYLFMFAGSVCMLWSDAQQKSRQRATEISLFSASAPENKNTCSRCSRQAKRMHSRHNFTINLLFDIHSRLVPARAHLFAFTIPHLVCQLESKLSKLQNMCICARQNTSISSRRAATTAHNTTGEHRGSWNLERILCIQ